MIKLISWAIGVGLGVTTGALLVALIMPSTREQILGYLKARYDHAMEAARIASQEKRAELEAELRRMQGQPPALPEGQSKPQLPSGRRL